LNILSEIWSSLSQNRFRTAMTGFAVAWGIFILVVLLGASNGLKNGIQDSYGSRLTNMVTVHAGWTSMPYKGFKEDRELFFTQEEADVLASLPEVEMFACEARKHGMNINYGTQYSSVTMKGVQGDYQVINKNNIYKGRFINTLDDRQRAKVCVINRRAEEELMNTDLLGKYIQVGDIAFLVVGICENGDRWDGSTLFIPFSTFMMLFEPDRHFDHIAMVLNEKAELKRKSDNMFARWDASSPFEDKVRAILAPMMQFDPADQRAIWIWNQADDFESQQGIMNAIRLFVLIIGLCTLVSGAVGVSNIMLVSVRERTKEFGIRKAIGAPPKTILMTVVGESTLITALFGYIGLFVGIGLMELINKMVPSDGDIPFKNPTVDIPVVVTATMILVIVGVIAGAIPAVRAIRIKPIEAMNSEK